MTQKRYVVGFLLKDNDTQIALIRKQFPEWQRGKWNGIGGKIDGLETPYQAMVREFEEEAGLRITDWDEFLTMTNPYVHFFTSRLPKDSKLNIRTMERIGEYVDWRFVDDLEGMNVVANLNWIIPLALQKERDPFIVHPSGPIKDAEDTTRT